MNTLCLTAHIYFDTEKQTLEEAEKEFWCEFEIVPSTIDVDIDESELVDENYNIIDN